MIHEAGQGVILGLDAQWLSVSIFLTTYALLVSERANPTIIVLLGAGLMIWTGIINQEQAVDGVDFNTIALLTGMMILVAVIQRSGVFQYVAVWATKRVKADPRGIMLMLATVTALFSALLDNVTTVLLIVPVTLLIVEKLELSPYPFLVAEIFASNIGGTATLIGDPPNILIGSAVGFSFVDFVRELGLVVVVIHVFVLLVLYLLWRRQLIASEECRARVMAFEEKDAITDSRLLWQSLVVLGLVIMGFLAAETIRIESGSIALTGAMVLLLLHTLGRDNRDQSQRVHDILNEVEWSTLAFFVGLFVLVHGMEASGLLALAGEEMMKLTGGDVQVTAFATLWVSAVASAIIDNVPFVATMIPLLETTSPTLGGTEAMAPVWWALSLGACLGGNGSLIGATANVIVAGFADRSGHPIRFLPFLLLAMPIMLLTVLIATVYLYLRHFI
ncbi:MAG: Na+/H+ antiporter NhaD/arsenite permease-like protein [Halieaceae bacterium]